MNTHNIHPSSKPLLHNQDRGGTRAYLSAHKSKGRETDTGERTQGLFSISNSFDKYRHTLHGKTLWPPCLVISLRVFWPGGDSADQCTSLASWNLQYRYIFSIQVYQYRNDVRVKASRIQKALCSSTSKKNEGSGLHGNTRNEINTRWLEQEQEHCRKQGAHWRDIWPRSQEQTEIGGFILIKEMKTPGHGQKQELDPGEQENKGLGLGLRQV